MLSLSRTGEFVEKSHSQVFDARKKKQGAVRARVEREREQAIAIGEAAKVARAVRRERTKETVRREEKAAKDYTARVRYETRPEVRQESSDLFQAQRNAAAEAARMKQERERAEVAEARERYMQAATDVRSKVEGLHASTKASKDSLVEARRQDAYRVRGRDDCR